MGHGDNEAAQNPFDRAMSRIGTGRFHYAAVAILGSYIRARAYVFHTARVGLANACDAVELLAIGYILPALTKKVPDWEKGSSPATHLLQTWLTLNFVRNFGICGFRWDVGGKPRLRLSERPNRYGLASKLYHSMCATWVGSGRRPCLLYSLALNAIFGGLSAVMPNVEGLVSLER